MEGLRDGDGGCGVRLGGGDPGRIRLGSVESASGTAVLDAGSLAGGEVVCG